MAIPTRMQGLTLRLSMLALSFCVQSYAFNIAPSISLRARALSHVSPRRPPLVMNSAAQSSSAEPAKSKGGALAVNYGPHIKIGKKGTILNLWGFFVMVYAMIFAITGFLYLKFRQILSLLLFGMLKPSPEHCCWIMHKWCNMVLRLGRSAPQVEGLENLPPKDETVLVCANHMSWYDVPVLHGFLGGRLLWSFAKAELVKLESLKSAIKTLRKLREFKGGAFTIARKSGCKIVPVTILGNDKVFPSNALMPIRPGNGEMKMVVHPPIDPEGKTDQELMEETRVAIASALPSDKIAAA